MRDYRGKRVDTGEWVQGYYKLCGHLVGTIEEDIYPTITPFNQYGYIVDPATIGQCTGIFGDFIKGEPKPGDNILRSFIYEGDIVEPVLTDGIHEGFSWGRQVVVFDRGAFCLKDRRGLITPMCNYSVNVKFKVLGNVYDNPELWEGAADA
ncbi:MAG: hypothetical protein J6Q53_04210 [Oscillospiraceae bacterium]|nr:hypothetical protein [Oscillospiraceae bacterium]